MLGKLSVFHHTRYIQILSYNHVYLAVTDYLLCHLMYRILPYVCYLFMKRCYLLLELPPVIRPLLLFGEKTLEMFQLFLILLQCFQVLIVNAMRAHCKPLEVQVNSNHLWIIRDKMRRSFISIIKKTGSVYCSRRIDSDSDVFEFPERLSVNHSFNPTDTLNIDSASFYICFSSLRYSETLPGTVL